MKALFIGGIKSGKSLHAEKFASQYAHTKPLYLATTEFIDEEMAVKIQAHQEQRGDLFITYEEPLDLYHVIADADDLVLVECMSMWINNMLYHGYTHDAIYTQSKKLLALQKDIVFVLNDVGGSVISENKLAREFVDISGRLSQLIASECDNVFHTIAGIQRQIK